MRPKTLARILILVGIILFLGWGTTTMPGQIIIVLLVAALGVCAGIVIACLLYCLVRFAITGTSLKYEICKFWTWCSVGDLTDYPEYMEPTELDEAIEEFCKGPRP